jgi:hypothetical protein
VNIALADENVWRALDQSGPAAAALGRIAMAKSRFSVDENGCRSLLRGPLIWPAARRMNADIADPERW